MPTLDWIGKKAVVNHHNEVPFHLLKEAPELSCGDPESGNLLVEGDNLLALKALLPYYAGQVKCIYIDPPYNTGNEGWIYNDNVNSPEILKWLGKVVGGELEDLSRHDKWLCMMYPRLRLLREFLREDAVIFISIGKDEVANMITVCDEIFGRKNILEILIWNTHGHTENQEDITGVHEYILLYAKDKSKCKIRNIIDPSVPAASKIRRSFAENSITKNGPKNPPSIIELPKGFPCEIDQLDLQPFDNLDGFMSAVKRLRYISRDITNKFDSSYPIRIDQMKVKSGRLVQACRVYSGWMSADKLREFIAAGCQPIEDNGTKLSYYLSKNGVVYYRREGREAHYVQSVLTELGTTETNKYMLESMGVAFAYPKPVELISYIISLFAGHGDIILDSFAGSGTTGHAVLNLNNEDNGYRRFIIIEMESNICRASTARRLVCVCNGYRTKKGEKIGGLGGGFRYCKLGSPCFDEQGGINPVVKYDDLARHVFFTETGSPLPKQSKTKYPLIGVHQDTAVYLLYNGVLKDKAPDSGNVLTQKVLAKLPKHNGPKVIFGTACRMGKAKLKASRITFHQIPYEIRVR